MIIELSCGTARSDEIKSSHDSDDQHELRTRGISQKKTNTNQQKNNYQQNGSETIKLHVMMRTMVFITKAVNLTKHSVL